MSVHSLALPSPVCAQDATTTIVTPPTLTTNSSATNSSSSASRGFRRRVSRIFRRSSVVVGPETTELAKIRSSVPSLLNSTILCEASDITLTNHTPKPRRCMSMTMPNTVQITDTEVLLSDATTFAAVSTQGMRPYNEDRFRVVTHLERFACGVLQCDPDVASLDDVIASRMLEKLASVDAQDVPAIAMESVMALEPTTTTEFFGIFDGHSGNACSTFLSLVFPVYLLQAPEFTTDLVSACETACRALNEEFQKREAEHKTGAGSTALTLMIRNHVAYLCNVGDCRAVLVSESGAEALTTDHKASNPDERRRIEAAGGMVLFINGVPRVDGRLAVARAFGDLDLDEHVIAKPDITKRALKSSDEFIVMGSDGLWDALSNEDVASCVHRHPEMDVEELSQFLVDRAIERGTYDNVTCIVVDVRDLDDTQ